MPLTIRNLSVLAYANGFTLWHYRAAGDTQAAVAERGFFDEAADMMAHGDLVVVSASDGGRVLFVCSDRDGIAIRDAA